MSVQIKPQSSGIKPVEMKQSQTCESKSSEKKTKGQYHDGRRCLKGQQRSAVEPEKYLADGANIHHRKRKADFSASSMSKLSGNSGIKLPKKFKLGGNIQDPLNLRSMDNEEVNRKENLVTPQSSPVPTPKHRNEIIEVLIPPNIKDPLNLLAEVTKHKKKRYKKRKSGDLSTSITVSSISLSTEKSTAVNTSNTGTDTDIDSTTNALSGDLKSKQVIEKVSSMSKPESPEKKAESKPKVNKHRRKHNSHRQKSGDERKKDYKSPCKQRHKSRASVDTSSKTFNKNNEKFQYGNYNRYYGYRLADQPRDPRLDLFQKEWFEGKDVLDIGCNVGFITLSVAKELQPKKIIGLDIDAELIKTARRNIRHYLSPHSSRDTKFPISMALCYGPIAAPPVFSSQDDVRFPNNVQFVQGNYVLKSDEDLAQQNEMYDIILCLSLTKWIHLNWGDDGLKRTLKRMFKQLKPQGKLILESQGWQSYQKKKRLTEVIFKNFHDIKLKPDKFREYLLSEVGFSKCEVIATPQNKSKGFQRPIYLFTKGSKSPTYSIDSETTSELKPTH